MADPIPTESDRAQARAWLASLKWNPMPPGAPTPPIRVEIGEDIVEDLARTLTAARLEGVRAGLEGAAVRSEEYATKQDFKAQAVRAAHEEESIAVEYEAEREAGDNIARAIRALDPAACLRASTPGGA